MNFALIIFKKINTWLWCHPLYHLIYRYIQNVYTDKLDDIVGEYDNTYHRTIRMTPVDVKDNKYIDFKK